MNRLTTVHLAGESLLRAARKYFNAGTVLSPKGAREPDQTQEHTAARAFSARWRYDFMDVIWRLSSDGTPRSYAARIAFWDTTFAAARKQDFI